MQLTLLIAFSLAFVATHLLMSHGAIRARLVAVLGVWPFRGLYSLVALLTLGAAVEIFRHNVHAGPELWQAPHWLAVAVAAPLMFLALQLFSLSLADPSPVGMIPATTEVRGVLRITRHPMNMSFACFGLAHLIGNGHLGDVAFFGSFALLSLLGAPHQDRRTAREGGAAFAAFLKKSSILPFVAILRGRNRLVIAELSFPLAVLGAAAFVALLVLHGRLFGVALW